MATEFQLQVWNAVESIPEGRVATYGMIAKAAGRPNTARYISGIISQHPKSEMLPWHRIVYSNGTVWIPEKGGTKRKALYKVL